MTAPFMLIRLSAAVFAFAASSTFADAPYDPTFAYGAPYYFSFDSANETIAGIASDHNAHVVTTLNLSAGNKEGVTRHLAPLSPSLIIRPAGEGTVDTSFASSGLATDFFSGGSSESRAIAVDYNNRIVVGGSAVGSISCVGGGSREITVFMLVRLLNDGSSSDGQGDWSFGNFGEAFYGDCDHPTAGLAGLAVEGHGDIVAVGTTIQESHERATLIRWTEAGDLDTTFGTAGVANISFGAEESGGAAVAIDSNGRIVAVIQTLISGQKAGVASRYQADGTLDTSFGSDGFTQLPNLEEFGSICCVQTDSQNRIVVAGTITTSLTTESYRADAFVARLTETGAFDHTFGSNGLVFPAGGAPAYAGGLAIDKHDRPVLVGSIASLYLPYGNAATFHLNLDGTPNSAIGSAGIYITPLGFSDTFATSVLIDQEGRPTLGIKAFDSDDRLLPVLVRYDELFGDGMD